MAAAMEGGAITSPSAAPARARSRLRGSRTVAPLVIWSALILAGWLVGTLLNNAGRPILLDSPPLYGNWDVRFGLGALFPVGVAAAFIAIAPWLVERASWRLMLWGLMAAAVAWPVSLALIEGPREIDEPLLWFTQYLQAVPLVESPGGFLREFNTVVNDYPSHVTAHPPLMVLIHWAMAEVGLGGSAWAAAMTLGAAATTVPATLISLRALSDESTARRVGPYLVIAPAALSIATTADAFFMAVGAWSVCALVLAMTRGPGRRSDLLALAGGLGFGVLIFLSFGLVLLGTVPLAVAWYRRRIRPVLVAAVGGIAVIAAFLALGYSWFEGLEVVREQYEGSVASERPYWYFVWNNFAAFALGALGPVIAVALWRLREPVVWALVGGGIAGILLADLSGMSKAEVERIWLPFLPWILCAAAALPTGPRALRGLLGVQATVTFLIATTVWAIW